MLLQQHSGRRARRSAFTLLEVLVVVAIIVMLAGTGGYYFFQQYEDAKLGKAKADVKALAGPVGAYKVAHGEYPATLQALTQQVNGNGPYCAQKDIIDPWGKPYQIDPNGPSHQGNEADIFTISPKGVRVSN